MREDAKAGRSGRGSGETVRDEAEGSRVEERFQRVASLAEVPEGELRAYEHPDGRVAVVHVEQELFAIGDECTHEGCSLAEGELGEQEDSVICPCHGSEFDLRTGEPLAGPADDPVPVYAVRVQDGWIEIARPIEGEW